MRCLRTLGVLSVTLSLVWSMTLETTSPRYLEGNHSFKIDLGDSIDSNNSTFSSAANHIFSLNTNDANYVNDSLKVTVNQRYVNLNTSLVLNTTNLSFTGSNVSNSSLQDEPKEDSTDVGEGRKMKTTNKRPTKKGNTVVNNFIRTTIKELKQNITKTKHSSKIRPTNKPKITTKINRKQQSTAKPNLKMKLSTIAPITIKLTKPTTKRPNVSTPKSYGAASTTRKPPLKIKLTTPTSKRKPTIKRIMTKWKDNVSNTSDLKQNWYEEGVPYPNPMPEVTSSSPPFPISDSGSQIFSSSTVENIFIDPIEPVIEQGVGSISPEIYSNSPSEPLQGVPPVLPLSGEEDLESVSIPSAGSSGSAENPISTFNLDMLPSADLTRNPSDNGCPTVHISSSVLSPLQRQGCSDLNLVLNTHYHQNQDTRNPSPPISTYDASAPGEDDIVEAIEDPIVDDGLANAGPTGGIAADSVPGTNIGGAGSPVGGSGGSGGSGGDGGGNGGFKLPDLKPMFEALGYLMRGLWWLLQKLMNPWLYIVPIVLFFKLGFLGILTLFPWWIPFVFLYFSVRTDEPKNTISHVKHHHKPVVIKHHDGWYWDQHTKTWKDVTDHHSYRYRRSDEDVEDMIDDKIIRFGDKYINKNNRSRKKMKRR